MKGAIFHLVHVRLCVNVCVCVRAHLGREEKKKSLGLETLRWFHLHVVGGERVECRKDRSERK